MFAGLGVCVKLRMVGCGGRYVVDWQHFYVSDSREARLPCGVEDVRWVEALWLLSGDVFFFSSRRRHTRFDCDWSSDVCSSDLRAAARQKTARVWLGYNSAVRRIAWIAALAACVAAIGAWTIRARRDPRLNVLVITVDTLRADHVGSYGYAAAQTPAIDRLAARGRRLAQ